MSDEQSITRLEDTIDNLNDEVRQLTARAEEAEALAEKYRESLDGIRYSAQEALR